MWIRSANNEWGELDIFTWNSCYSQIYCEYECIYRNVFELNICKISFCSLEKMYCLKYPAIFVKEMMGMLNRNTSIATNCSKPQKPITDSQSLGWICLNAVSQFLIGCYTVLHILALWALSIKLSLVMEKTVVFF